MTIQEEAKQLKKLKLEAKTLKSEADKAELAFRTAERKLWERMQAEETGSIKVAGTNFVPQSTVYAQIQDREAFVAWAKENSPELIQEQERKALLNELVNDRLALGQALPDGLGYYCKEYISQRVG